MSASKFMIVLVYVYASELLLLIKCF